MIRSAVNGLVASAVLAILIVWGGFRWPIETPEPVPEASIFGRKTAIYDGLPSPLQFYLRQTVSRTPPVAENALIWGTGWKRFPIGPVHVWLPVRWVLVADSGSGIAWTGRVMWFGIPIATVHESFHGDEECSVLIAEGMGTVVLGAWLPNRFLETARGAWSAVDRWTARLTAKNGNEVVVTFDPRTRALSAMLGSGCPIGTEGTGDQLAWSVRFTEWGAPGGLTVPVSGASIVNGEPHYRFTVRGIIYNIDTRSLSDGGGPLPDVREIVQRAVAMKAGGASVVDSSSAGR